MQHWVECTVESGRTIFVNLSLVVSISRVGSNTMLTYACEDGGVMVVSDMPEDILMKPKLKVSS